MSSLSNRVMNMKFMQKADDLKISEEREQNQKKIADLSEWVLPYSKSLLKMAQSKPKIESVGYGSIMSAPTRRSWGTKVEQEATPSPEKEASKNKSEDLNELWGKRTKSNNANSSKKRRLS
ncbi:uncharacterized protein SPAPADRAFT_149578 [Spathaspora passalidarum NRRL Y-27907]|uniref:M-phase phosphoprotein 6 n=1 Tax=Spathaspora passalidarum (strain NRRL Y-27907 / 11-Y1) TaxID=619300 RepID=G3AJ30_SPAPN|nr:uncharacterized protein SPAPADRAFT_149578 [Spathaspora passalidarum NRRL Y-27907]EGW34542.1 hypothetical protein SPAPADRAFT_149578 [Spathaspora passalidarum NRRL Y-27907]